MDGRLSGKNDVLLIARNYSQEPMLGAVAGVELKKELAAKVCMMC